MSEVELDFEAEIPAIANENCIETEEGEDDTKLSTEKMEDEKSETEMNTRELMNVFSDVQANTDNDTLEIQSNIGNVESDEEEEVENACNIQSNSSEIKVETKIPFNTGNLESDEEKVKNISSVQSNTSQIQIEANEIQSNIGGVESVEEEVTNNVVQSNSSQIDIKTTEIQSNTEDVESDNGEIESDTGEIHSDSELTKAEVLEDGEIEDNSPAPSKNNEAVCRFFLRGTCLYGLECRNLHVSNTGYSMFDPVLTNRSNFNVHKPVLFLPPPPMLMMPNIECPWERGIKNAKIVMQNANYKKDHDDEDEDLENDWERCLEEAKQSVQQKLYLKRQNTEVKKPSFDMKYSEREKVRERYPTNKEPENNIYKTYRQESHVFSYSKYKKEETNLRWVEKTKPEPKSTPDHLKWVDPWRRSKSPRKRIRSMSFSISPSPVRKRSISSSSSSSSCFKERIYGGSRKSNSPKRFKPRSRSNSLSPPPKKSRSVRTRSYSRERSYTRSGSRSLSRSPRKQRCSRSCSSSSSSSVSSEEYFSGERKKVADKPPVKKFTPFKFEAKKPKIITSGIPKDRVSPSRRNSVTKAGGRASSPCHSDKSSCSDISMTSLSYTSLSSVCGKNNSRNNNSKVNEGYASKSYQSPQVRSTDAFNREKRYQKYDSFDKYPKKLEGFSNRKKSSPDRVETKYTEESSKAKLKTDGSKDLSSKSSTAKKDVKQNASKATMELLKYQSDDVTSKPPTDKTVSTQKSSKSATELPKYQSKDLTSKPPIDKIAAKQNSLKVATSSKEPVSKPAPAKTASKAKNSKATLELLKYLSFGNSEATANPVTQPPAKAKCVGSKLLESNKSTSDSTRILQPKESDTATPKVNPIKQPKPQKNDNPALLKKLGGSKREILLQQLQAIEDAIARKKQPVE